MSILIGFFASKKTLAATFRETRAPTCGKYVTEQGVMIPNL